MTTAALLIVAAGAGTRMREPAPKAFLELSGEPVLAHAVRRGVACAAVSAVVIVAPASHTDAAATILAKARVDAVAPDREMWSTVVAGGASRAASVRLGLVALAPRPEQIVLVHDAARALAPTPLFDRVCAAVHAGAAGVVPVLPVVDTIKRVDARGIVVETPPRGALRIVQTPQGFQRALLERAHQTVPAAPDATTDDAVLVEALGVAIATVPGEELAGKITTPADLRAAATSLDLIA